MSVRRPPLEYAVTMDRDTRLAIPGGTILDAGEDWTPEHLLLAAVARCAVAKPRIPRRACRRHRHRHGQGGRPRRAPGRRQATCPDRAGARP